MYKVTFKSVYVIVGMLLVVLMRRDSYDTIDVMFLIWNSRRESSN